MSNREAIEIIKYASAFNSDNSPLTKALECVIAATEELEQYRELGTLEQVREAVEKLKLKKPIVIDKQFKENEVVEIEWKCPVCGLNVIEEPPCQNYCQKCGKKLDWSDEE